MNKDRSIVRYEPYDVLFMEYVNEYIHSQKSIFGQQKQARDYAEKKISEITSNSKVKQSNSGSKFEYEIRYEEECGFYIQNIWKQTAIEKNRFNTENYQGGRPNKSNWVSTGNKVTIKKQGSRAAQKTVFRNSVTGKLCVRKASIAKDGTRSFSYVKF